MGDAQLQSAVQRAADFSQFMPKEHMDRMLHRLPVLINYEPATLQKKMEHTILALEQRMSTAEV